MATSGSFNTSGYSSAGYPDHYVFSWTLQSQSIEGNYSTISWQLVGAGGSDIYRYTCVKQKYVIVNGVKQSDSTIVETKNGTVAFRGTSRINHNEDGTGSFSASAGGAFYYYGSYNSTGSGSWSLPTIPRKAVILTAPDFTDEENPTITYSNPAGSSVTTLHACISLTGALDDVPYRDISKTGSSYTFELTEQERNTLRNACPNSNSLQVRFFVTSVIGGTTYYSTLTRTMTIVNGNPTFTASNVTYQDSNNTTVAVTGDNQKLVQNLSNLLVTITSATAQKGSSIASYEATINNLTQTITSAGNINFGVINSGSDLELAVKVIDSRGNSTTITKTVTFLEWKLPTAVISLKRRNNYENTTYLKVKATYSSINSNNTISIKFQYKKSTDSSYSSQTTIQDNTQVTLTFNKNYAWDIRVILTDRFGTSTYNTTLAKGSFILFVDTKKLSVGVNCFPESNETLEVNGKPVVCGESKIMKKQFLDLSSLSTEYFYPAIWMSNDFFNIEISSPAGLDSAPYNQNRLKACISSKGWSDMPRRVDVLQHGVYSEREITIHSIWCGLRDGHNAIYLRGGYIYRCYADETLTLYTDEIAFNNETFSLLDTTGNPVTSFENVDRQWIYTNMAYINARVPRAFNSFNADSATEANKTVGTLTIQKNGTNVNTFDGSGDTTANITVPTSIGLTTTQIISGYSTSAKTGSVSGAIGIYIKATPRKWCKPLPNIYST